MGFVRTKIICTVGPATASYEMLEQLIDAGMDVARLNFSHGTHDDHRQVIRALQELREKKKRPLAIMLDTKGPEVRIGMIKNGSVQLTKGDEVLLVKEQLEGDKEKISVHPSFVLEELEVGMTLLIDDGNLAVKVIAVGQDGVRVRFQNGGVLRSQKKINTPGVDLGLPPLTEDDIADITFGCTEGIDLIAASFIQDPEGIVAIRDLVSKHTQDDIMIFAKIENARAVHEFEGILQVSDGIMVARGDLGVEIPLTQVPRLQKMMIRQCYRHAKPSITATQMLESMIRAPRPTRAEVSDVANAIYDSTSCVMLSGETAVGEFPIAATEMMRSIVSESEKDFDYRHFFYSDQLRNYNDIASSLALAAVSTAYSSNAKAIIAYTSTGFTARMMSRFRPAMPIIALTPSKKTYHQIIALWGVIPFYGPAKHSEEAFKMACCFALQAGIIHYGDLVVFTAGSNFGVAGSTNTMIVLSVGKVLVRGKASKGAAVMAPVTHIISSDLAKRTTEVAGKIAVLSHCDHSFQQVVEGAAALVLQNMPDDTESERIARSLAKDLKVPLLARADGADTLLKEGQLVTLDPSLGLIFDGVKEAEAAVLDNFCRGL